MWFSLQGLDRLHKMLKSHLVPILEVTKPLLEVLDHELILIGVPPIQRLPGLVNEVGQGHADIRLAQGHQLGLQRMQLGLDGGGQNLDDADVTGLGVVLELVAEGLGQVVQGGLGGAVVGAAGEGDEGEAGGDDEDGGGGAAPPQGHQVGEEGGDGEQGGGVVGGELGEGFGGEVGGGEGLAGEGEGALDAGVEDDGGEVWVGGCYPFFF